MPLIGLFTYCRLEYIKLGSPNDPTWSDFPQTLTQTQGARRYVTLFESPFVDSVLSKSENNALRASSLLEVPPPPPEVQPLEGLQGINLQEANLTQWASYTQDVASWMWKPPCVATSCPNKDIAGILHKLENLSGVGFCHLCYALGNRCRCLKAAPQTPLSYRDTALWVPPQASYASMASSMITTASTPMIGVSATAGPPPGFPTRGPPSPMDVSPASQSYNLLAQAGVSRGLGSQHTPGSAGPQAPGATSLCQEWPSTLHQQTATSGSHEVTQATPYWQAIYPPRQVRFAPLATEAKTTTSTSQSESKATRGRPQYKEHEGCQGLASHTRKGRDKSSTRGPRDRSSTRGPRK